MAYLLDADVLIAAKNAHYRFNVCPGFWKWIEQGYQSGIVRSVEKVRGELLEPEDSLTTWVNTVEAGFFLTPTQDDVPSLSTVAKWVGNQRYSAAAVRAFLLKADYYLIAQALTGSHTVITHEVSAPNSKRVVKIPDICNGVGVSCMSPFKMLEREGARFTLED